METEPPVSFQDGRVTCHLPPLLWCLLQGSSSMPGSGQWTDRAPEALAQRAAYFHQLPWPGFAPQLPRGQSGIGSFTHPSPMTSCPATWSLKTSMRCELKMGRDEPSDHVPVPISPWCLGTNRISYAVQGAHEGGIFALCMLRDGTLVSGGGKDRKLISWNANYQKLHKTEVR